MLLYSVTKRPLKGLAMQVLAYDCRRLKADAAHHIRFP